MAIAVLLTVLPGTPANARPLAAPNAVPPAAGGTVTLITGDRVELRGSAPPVVFSGKGRASVPFRISTKSGRVRVIPGDAVPLIAAGRLDPRLFDVTTLLEVGYDDARRADLPLIVRFAPSADATAHMSAAGATVGRPLSSVSGAAVLESKKDASAFWDTVTSGAGIATVWLNGKRRLTLDRSVAQIGAPAAWQRGLTGKQVDVAIVDSGIDTGHPDLAGKVVDAANFTDEPAGDRSGHGTHVASTVAGSGAGSGGAYRGVAADVRLLDAKVCVGDGTCAEDAILAGMEWAAGQRGAPIVNLSLGGPDLPGVDPLEEAVNTLSAQHGTLFVVAAGNDGPTPGTVGSPASADAALAVGAVDRQDAVAFFSSRGPRVGDGAIKPELTAPGVGIVAARAAGTTLGEPVGEHYVTADGTSMATPHVAGAAAILREQHPDWRGEQLKAALLASAQPTEGVDVFDQGAGRVDVARAIDTSVTATPPSVSFGLATWPHDGEAPMTATVTYHNAGTEAVSLDVAVPGPAPATLFAVTPGTVELPAGGTAQVTVTADVAAPDVPIGRHGAWLVATAGGAVVRTPVAVDKESERYEVKLTHVGRDGNAPREHVTFLDRFGDCGADVDCGGFSFGSEPTSVLRLPPGRYVLADFSTTTGSDWTLLVRPVFELHADTALTLDARAAKPFDMTAPRASARLQALGLNIGARVGRPDVAFSYVLTGDATTPVYVGDLGGPRPARDDLVSAAYGRFAEPGPNGDFVDSPYEYNLLDFAHGRVFNGVRSRPRQHEFAKVETSFAANTDEPRTGETGHFGVPAAAPWISWGIAERGLISTRVPFHRTVYFLAVGVQWRGSWFSQRDPEGGSAGLLIDLGSHVYRPGRTYQEEWNRGVLGPKFGQGRNYRGVHRQGNLLTVSVPSYADADPDHLSEPREPLGRARLYRDGEPVEDWPLAGHVSAVLPPDESGYRLEHTVDVPWSQVSTTVSSAWTFRSGHVPDTEAVALPLMIVRFTPELDDRNHAAAGRRFAIPVSVQGHHGAPQPQVAKVTVDVSYDDGATWRPAILTRRHDGWRATVDNPAGGAVSLRTKATDTSGSTVEQTIIRAYLV